MPDNYARFSHADLYAQLQAGQPDQVEGLAATWSSMGNTLSSLSAGLTKDLQRLKGSWDSVSGDEFGRRIAVITEFTADLSENSSKINTGLRAAAADLRSAQSKAEDPAETDDHDSTIGGAVIGTVVAGPVGGLVGAELGHQRDKEQKAQAKNRMVAVVTQLGGDYQLESDRYLVVDTPVPSSLPQDSSGGGVRVSDGGNAGSVAGAGGTGGGGGIGSAATGDPSSTRGFAPPLGAGYAPGAHSIDSGPHSYSGTGSYGGSGSYGGAGGSDLSVGTADTSTGRLHDGQGTSLTGGGSGTLGGSLQDYENLGTSLSGAATPLDPGARGAAAAGGLPGTGALAAGAGGGAGLGVGGGGAGGVGGLPAGIAGGASVGGNRAPASGTGLKGTGLKGMGVKGDGLSSDRSPQGESKSAANARGQHPMTAMRNGMGYRGNEDTDQTDERSTWLTEDELVWQGDDDVPPPVLGS